MRIVFGFIGSLLEALFKCAPVFAAQALAIYPLLALGQGQEAMRALLDPGPAGVAPFVFWLALSYSCVLTLGFLFFLLAPWNYPAPDGRRAFCRVWVPSALTLVLGLAWPWMADREAQGATLYAAIAALVNGGGVLGLVVAVWLRMQPSPGRAMAWWAVVSAVTLLAAVLAGSVAAIVVVCALSLTVLCVLIREDFVDARMQQRAAAEVHAVGLGFAGLVVLAALMLSRSSVPWRMFMGSPGIVVTGFAFFVALAFLITALLRRLSRPWRWLVWLGLGTVALVASPINREPLRTLSMAAIDAEQGTTADHFSRWLRARGPSPDGRPYPVFIVAAEGGGVRAAYWTSTLLAALEERYPGFGRHVYAISGVSGGSVGAAAFAAMAHDLPQRGAKGCAPLQQSGMHGLRACTAYLFQWDLLGPPLAGLLMNDLPFGAWRVQRAQMLEEALETAWFGSMETRRFEMPFADLWKDDPYGTPSLILNTTSVDTGDRYVVSDLSRQGRLGSAADVQAITRSSLRLSTAAFLSARFPVVSPEAIADTASRGPLRWADGGYFNNSGMAAVAQLLADIEPALSSAEFAGKVRPVVLVVSSSPAPEANAKRSAPGRLEASVAGALLSPLSILQLGGQAHDATYLKQAADRVGETWVLKDLRPPAGTAEIALGWMLSMQSRCALDRHVNTVLDKSKASQAIGQLLGAGASPPASWTSCGAGAE